MPREQNRVRSTYGEGSNILLYDDSVYVSILAGGNVNRSAFMHWLLGSEYNPSLSSGCYVNDTYKPITYSCKVSSASGEDKPEQQKTVDFKLVCHDSNFRACSTKEGLTRLYHRSAHIFLVLVDLENRNTLESAKSVMTQEENQLFRTPEYQRFWMFVGIDRGTKKQVVDKNELEELADSLNVEHDFANFSKENDAKGLLEYAYQKYKALNSRALNNPNNGSGFSKSGQSSQGVSLCLPEISLPSPRQLAFGFSSGLFISGATILITLAATVGLSISTGGALPIVALVMLAVGGVTPALIKLADCFFNGRKSSSDSSQSLALSKQAS